MKGDELLSGRQASASVTGFRSAVRLGATRGYAEVANSLKLDDDSIPKAPAESPRACARGVGGRSGSACMLNVSPRQGVESTNLAQPSGSLALKTFGDAWEIQSES